MARRGPTMADTALELIRERGPMAHDALVEALVAAGRTRARDPDAAVASALAFNPAFLRSGDGRWCSLPDQLDGSVFCVRPTRLERRYGVVLARDWLSLVESLVGQGRVLRRGGEARLALLDDVIAMPGPEELDEGADAWDLVGDALVEDLLGLADELGMGTPRNPRSALVRLSWRLRTLRLLDGPPGWIPPLGPRDLLGIQLWSGTLDTIRVPRSAVNGPHVEAAARRLADLACEVIGRVPTPDDPPVVPIEELLRMAAAEAPELFRRPLPPLDEVVERGGLEVEDGLVGHPEAQRRRLGLGGGRRFGPGADAEDSWGAWTAEPGGRLH